jgi:hypothetical protein
MRTLLNSWVVRAVTLLFVASAAFAQDRVPFRQAELDQMLAPVALYPDALLSQMLMASTYPLEVVQAARWSRANPGLKGQSAVDAVERMDWDPSVKSLTAFPQVLSMMDEKLEWTERLGEAFLAQQADVMAAVQELRRGSRGRKRPSSSSRPCPRLSMFPTTTPPSSTGPGGGRPTRRSTGDLPWAITPGPRTLRGSTGAAESRSRPASSSVTSIGLTATSG